MKQLLLLITLMILPFTIYAEEYHHWPSYYVQGIYEVSPYGDFQFNGKRYKKISLPPNQAIDTAIGKKLASKIYQVVDPEGDDLDIIVIFRDEPPCYITNHYGVICYTVGTVEKPKGVKGLEQYPDTYTTTFTKWYMCRD